MASRLARCWRSLSAQSLVELGPRLPGTVAHERVVARPSRRARRAGCPAPVVDVIERVVRLHHSTNRLESPGFRSACARSSRSAVAAALGSISRGRRGHLPRRDFGGESGTAPRGRGTPHAEIGASARTPRFIRAFGVEADVSRLSNAIAATGVALVEALREGLLPEHRAGQDGAPGDRPRGREQSCLGGGVVTGCKSSE